MTLLGRNITRSRTAFPLNCSERRYLVHLGKPALRAGVSLTCLEPGSLCGGASWAASAGGKGGGSWVPWGIPFFADSALPLEIRGTSAADWLIMS